MDKYDKLANKLVTSKRKSEMDSSSSSQQRQCDKRLVLRLRYHDLETQLVERKKPIQENGFLLYSNCFVVVYFACINFKIKLSVYFEGVYFGACKNYYANCVWKASIYVEKKFSPMADPTFEAGRPGESAIELGRVIDRGLRESRAVDMESLCVVAGKAVWAIRVDLHILDNGGNLIDAANIAALTALLTFRRPECTVGGENSQEVILHDPEVREPLPLTIHHLPVAVTFAFFGEGNIMVIDPSYKEEAVMGGRMTATLNSNGDICAVQKGGGEGVMPSVVMQCLRIASIKAADITSKIKNAVDAYNTERALRKVKRHSTSVAQKISIPDAIMKESQVDEFISNKDQMLEDELGRYSTGGVGNESSLSHRRDGSSISKAFIGGPSNWGTYSKGISTTLVRAQPSLGPSTINREQDMDIQTPTESNPEEITVLNASSSSLVDGSGVVQQNNTPKSLKDAVKKKDKKKTNDSSTGNAK